MQEQLVERSSKYAAHLSSLCGITCSVLDTVRRQFLFSCPSEQFCSSCTCFRCQDIHTHLYGSSEAYRWNGKYIYYCPLGLVFVASSVSNDTGTMTGSIIAGPLVMGNLQDTLMELPNREMSSLVASLPIFTTSKVNDLAEILAAATVSVSGLPHSHAGSFVYEQEKMLNTIYSTKDLHTDDNEEYAYLIECEKKLHAMIGSRDKTSAQTLLNELLGHIYFASDFDLDTIKTRILELIVLLSRATIDAGADIHEIYLFNTNYIREIEQFHSIEELSVWLTGIMHRFINYSFDFAQVKHSDTVYKVMEYVKGNYARKITLDDIARHVFLSRSYLSSIFKEETGDSLFTYINRVRVEKSKLFLLDNTISLVDIASLCGFEDQSYFTKVFKKATGVSPKRYRDNRGKIPPV